LKEPALNYGKQVDGIAKEFQAMIIQTETKLQIQRKIVEDNEARKQREVEEAEEARVNNINRAINSLKQSPMECINKSSEVILNALELLEVPSPDFYSEFYDEAIEIYKASNTQMKQMYDNQILVENAEKVQAERDLEAKRVQDEEDAKLQAEKNALEEQQAKFQKEKDDFEAYQKTVHDEAERKRAEEEADTLMEKQEAQKLEDAKMAEANFGYAKDKTLDYFNNCVHYEALLEDIVNGLVPNVKWEI